jgi:hypothetical protein
MPLGPTEVSTQIVGDYEALEQLISTLSDAQTKMVANSIIDTGNGQKTYLTVRCLNAKPGN